MSAISSIASSPLASTTSDLSPDRPVQYTFNSKVMVAAMVILFVVVLFVVSLHIYAKWFWHQGRAARWPTTNVLNASWHRRRRRLEQLVTDESMATNPSCVGLNPSTINLLPTFIYKGRAVHEAEPLLECAVCLSEFQAHEKGRILPNCKHSFHIDCIDMWFHSHSTCPLCRTPILPLMNEQHAGDLSNHPPSSFQHTLSSTAHQGHANEQNASASVSADPQELLSPRQNMPGLELHSQQEVVPANIAGHKAPMLNSLVPLASVSCAQIPSYGEFFCKDVDIAAGLPHMGASGSSSARATPTEILKQQERMAIARSTSLSMSRGLSEDVQVCSPQPQKSVSFRMSIKRFVSRELSKGRSRVFPSGQVNAESELSTSTMNSPV